ncbi:hypothetical protein [Limosilactobacillus portuensis]|uniref:hypothetical protein n=1 Tax=Limosilactobacillus portuensis TaxID=2742601 RepID=UPI003D71AFEB
MMNYYFGTVINVTATAFTSIKHVSFGETCFASLQIHNQQKKESMEKQNAFSWTLIIINSFSLITACFALSAKHKC